MPEYNHDDIYAYLADKVSLKGNTQMEMVVSISEGRSTHISINAWINKLITVYGLNEAGSECTLVFCPEKVELYADRELQNLDSGVGSEWARELLSGLSAIAPPAVRPTENTESTQSASSAQPVSSTPSSGGLVAWFKSLLKRMLNAVRSVFSSKSSSDIHYQPGDDFYKDFSDSDDFSDSEELSYSSYESSTDDFGKPKQLVTSASTAHRVPAQEPITQVIQALGEVTNIHMGAYNICNGSASGTVFCTINEAHETVKLSDLMQGGWSLQIDARGNVEVYDNYGTQIESMAYFRGEAPLLHSCYDAYVRNKQDFCDTLENDVRKAKSPQF